MNDRTRRLRKESLDTEPSISSERAEILTRFYRAELGKHSVPVMRALAFRYLCEHKALYLGDDELIVGERGPRPKAATASKTCASSIRGRRPATPCPKNA